MVLESQTSVPLQGSVHVNSSNRPQFLDRCIACFYRQTRMDFEMVIADDGSDVETLRVILRHQKDAPFPIVHIWQPPMGHRRAEILNKGIGACRTPYVIFTDCDSLVPAHFVETHLSLRRPNRMLIGGRVRLSRENTEQLTTESIRSGAFEKLAAPKDLRELRLRHWKNVWEIWMRRKRRPHNLGLNMSLELKSLEAINGYDNEYRGWGNADGDLRERLRKVGVTCLSVWRRVFVYHQWHPQLPRGAGNSGYAARAVIPARAANGLAEARQTWLEQDQKAYREFLDGFLR